MLSRPLLEKQLVSLQCLLAPRWNGASNSSYSSPEIVKGASPQMTWKIEKVVTGKSTAFRLSGRIHAAHLKELKAVLGNGAADMALDIGEVTIVDVDVVRFLGQLERKGIRLLRCSPYIREWISKECDGRRRNRDRSD